MSDPAPSALLSDAVLSPPPGQLVYWVLQYCSFDGLSSCRVELRELLAAASARQLAADVDSALAAAQASAASAGGGRGRRGGGSGGADRATVHSRLSVARDAALAAVDAEVALRVRLRRVYASIVSCSYEHTMGVATWLAELRDECDAAGLPLTAQSSLFCLQLAAIANIAARAADRPRTTKAEFDHLMRHTLSYAIVADGDEASSDSASKRDLERQQAALEEVQQLAADYWHAARQSRPSKKDAAHRQRVRDEYSDERVAAAAGQVVQDVLRARKLDSPVLASLYRVHCRGQQAADGEQDAIDEHRDSDSGEEEEEEGEDGSGAAEPTANATSLPQPARSPLRPFAAGRLGPTAPAASRSQPALHSNLQHSRLQLNHRRGEDPLKESELIAKRATRQPRSAEEGDQEDGEGEEAGEQGGAQKAADVSEDGADSDAAPSRRRGGRRTTRGSQRARPGRGANKAAAQSAAQRQRARRTQTAQQRAPTEHEDEGGQQQEEQEAEDDEEAGAGQEDRAQQAGQGDDEEEAAEEAAQQASRETTEAAAEEAEEEQEDGGPDDASPSKPSPTARTGRRGKRPSAGRSAVLSLSSRGAARGKRKQPDQAEDEAAAAAAAAAAEERGSSSDGEHSAAGRKRRQKRAWAEEETAALIAGMDQFAAYKTKWKMIKDHYSAELAARTTVDLKDKWRVIRKHNQQHSQDRSEASRAKRGADGERKSQSSRSGTGRRMHTTRRRAVAESMSEDELGSEQDEESVQDERDNK